MMKYYISLLCFILFSVTAGFVFHSGNAYGFFSTTSWGMTPNELKTSNTEVYLYQSRAKSSLPNVYMFAGARVEIDNRIVIVEYGGFGLNGNLQVILAYVPDPNEHTYYQYREMLVSGYGSPARSTEIPGSLKHPAGHGMLESHWDLFDRNVIIKLIFNGNGKPRRLNMMFSSIRAATKIMNDSRSN